MSAVGPVAGAATVGSAGTAAVVDRSEPLAVVGTAEHAGSQAASRSAAGTRHRAHSGVAHLGLQANLYSQKIFHFFT